VAATNSAPTALARRSDVHSADASVNRLTIEDLSRAPGMQAFAAPLYDERAETLAVAEEVVELGISVQGALAILGLIEKHCDAVSRGFVELFLQEVWTPFQAAGMPAEQWPEIEQSLGRLRPVATEALLAIFQQRISAEIESAVAVLARPPSKENR
jgi:hypothetical protein